MTYRLLAAINFGDYFVTSQTQIDRLALLWEVIVAEVEEAAFEEMAVVVVRHRNQEADPIDSAYIPVPAAVDSLSTASSVVAVVD